MKTFDIHDARGCLVAFEVSNTVLGRRRACRIVASVPGVTVLRRPGVLSWWREAVFCEFTLGGTRFELWEPFGDNSRYWVGPAEEAQAGPPPEFARVREAFVRAAPRPFRAPAV